MNNEASDNAQSLSEKDSDKRSARELQLVRAGAAEFGIIVEDISAIVNWRKPAPLPFAPRSVLGVVSIEGRMLTVLDLARLMFSGDALTDAAHTSPGQIVGLRGDEQLALAVDMVGEKIDFADSDVSSKSETAKTLVLGVLHRQGAEIIILNLQELFLAAIQGHERRRRRF
jgi:chemotaxis signal transduction protein